MKCFITLLNVGQNLKKSLKLNFKIWLLTKADSPKKQIYMNEQTLSKIKMKKRAYHPFFKTKDQHDCQMYAKYRNHLRNACRKAVTVYEKSLLGEVKSNPNAFFRYDKNKMNFKNASPDLVDNGKILSDNNSKAKAFNMFFKSVFYRGIS